MPVVFSIDVMIFNSFVHAFRTGIAPISLHGSESL